MICYRDMTFCSKGECLGGMECSRFVSDRVREGGEKWWGSPNFPLAVSDFTECMYWSDNDMGQST